MKAAEYMTRELFEWDGAYWTAETSTMTPEAMELALRRGKYGVMLFETARELASGGTFDITSVTRGTRTYTVVHDPETDLSRLYRRRDDAPKVRAQYPGSG